MAKKKANSKDVSTAAAKFGQLGGRARAAKMTDAQRSASAAKAAKARWEKKAEETQEEPV